MSSYDSWKLRSDMDDAPAEPREEPEQDEPLPGHAEALDAAIEALIAADEAVAVLQRVEPDAAFAEKLDKLEMTVERTVDELMVRSAKVRCLR